MKSAFLVALDDQFFERAGAEMSSWSYPTHVTQDDIRLDAGDAGSLLITHVGEEADWEWRDLFPSSCAEYGQLRGYLVLCRNESLFCCVARALKTRLGIDLWVVDDGDEVLDAGTVDPASIRL